MYKLMLYLLAILISDNNPVDTVCCAVTQRLALSPHSQKVPGLIQTCAFLCASVGSLRVLWLAPTVQTHARLVNWQLDACLYPSFAPR